LEERLIKRSGKFIRIRLRSDLESKRENNFVPFTPAFSITETLKAICVTSGRYDIFDLKVFG